MVELGVSDTGTGIPPEPLAQVFDRFYRPDAARARTGGAGSGLAICKTIVEAPGGSITIESAQGTGPTVRVRRPIAG